MVRVAAGAREALDVLAKFRPDVVVTDLTMPTVDGVVFLGLLRSSPGFTRIPAIALTGVKESEVERRVRAAGFDAYLVKPIDTPVLVEQILRLVLQTRGQR